MNETMWFGLYQCCVCVLVAVVGSGEWVGGLHQGVCRE